MRVSLLSFGFIALAAVAIVALPASRGLVRQFLFLALNLVFVFGLVLDPTSAAATLLFLLAGYVLVRLAGRGRRFSFVLGLALFIALFVFLQRYDFLQWFLPDSLLAKTISTVGLSFLFFKIVHMMIDSRGGTLGPLDFATYLNYCLNFTTFLMGPLQRYQDYRDQWRGVTLAIPLEFEAHLDAAVRSLRGLVKAYVIAPFFLARALTPDTDLLSLTAAGIVVQTYAFWFFLYFNFSGYCDVVIGIGSLFGVRPPENFNRPYLARNIADFWLRQHRSLTQWLTDYVFTPLYKHLLASGGVRRHRLLAANLSLVATMVISGLWHGTTMSFLLFGLIHGAWFVVYRTWDHWLTGRLGTARVRQLREKPLMQAAAVFLTFNATAFAFIFFQLSPARVTELLAHLVSV